MQQVREMVAAVGQGVMATSRGDVSTIKDKGMLFFG